jgi:hypothetical protein
MTTCGFDLGIIGGGDGPHFGCLPGKTLIPKSFSHRVRQELERFSNLKGRACGLPADKGSQEGGGAD